MEVDEDVQPLDIFGFLIAIGFQSISNLQFDTCLSVAILTMLSEA